MKSIANLILHPPKPDGRLTRIGAAMAVVSVLGLVLAVGAVFRTPSAWSNSRPDLATVEVDRGDIDQVVIETGSVEGSDDDVVRCEVESFLALPAAAAPVNSERRPIPSKSRRAAAAAPASNAVTMARGTSAKALGNKSKAKSSGEGGQAAAKAAKGASRPDEKSQTAATAGANANANAAFNQGPAAETAKVLERPVIRSFDQTVTPHVPLRLALADQGAMASIEASPPTILSIVPEGTPVRKGDIVCELDSSAFHQALEVQQYRFLRAKAWVDQAGYILEAAKIALREYQDGILPQDIQLVRHYIGICETDRDRAGRNLDWARTVLNKGFRTHDQVESDAARLELAEITLRDARGMLERLVQYTGKKVLTAHKAKVEAIRADQLSLESSLRLERDRLERIEAMIAHCTMRAPDDGIVVYANRVNGWGTVESHIREGMRVYQSQPIFRLLDPRRMHVEAKINESQVSHLRSGQPVLIHLDAYPGRVMKGSVAEIMPIPSVLKGPFSDVHTFLANVRIESGGFAALRTGLTAELKFLVDKRRRVPRVPLEAIRWFGDQTFAARVISTTTGRQWLWRPIELGASDTTFAEVVSGLEPGDHVVAHAEDLPPAGLGPPDTSVTMDLALGH